MARIRSIHPDACKSRKLARVSAEAERCFWRLQVHCDDAGRAEDDPELLAGQMFLVQRDVSPDDVDAWLWELAAAGLIVRYQVDGLPYLAVEKFAHYQKPRHRQPSTLPDPSEGECRTRVGHVSDIGPTSVGHASAGEERRGEEQEGPDRNVRRLTSAERRRLLAQTASLIAERRGVNAAAAAKHNPDRYLSAAVAGIQDEIRDAVNEIVTHDPECTPEELADELEPSHATVHDLRVELTHCDECGWDKATSQYPHGPVHAEWLTGEAS